MCFAMNAVKQVNIFMHCIKCIWHTHTHTQTHIHTHMHNYACIISIINTFLCWGNTAIITIIIGGKWNLSIGKWTLQWHVSHIGRSAWHICIWADLRNRFICPDWLKLRYELKSYQHSCIQCTCETLLYWQYRLTINNLLIIRCYISLNLEQSKINVLCVLPLLLSLSILVRLRHHHNNQHNLILQWYHYSYSKKELTKISMFPFTLRQIFHNCY